MPQGHDEHGGLRLVILFRERLPKMNKEIVGLRQANWYRGSTNLSCNLVIIFINCLMLSIFFIATLNNN